MITTLPEIIYTEKGEEYLFLQSEVLFADNDKILVKSPYLHPQAFQQFKDWLPLDVDMRAKNAIDAKRTIEDKICLLVDYLENCYDKYSETAHIPCHSMYKAL